MDPGVHTIFRRFSHTFQLNAVESNLAATYLLVTGFQSQGNEKGIHHNYT